MIDIAKEIYHVSLDIAQYLKFTLIENNQFPSRSFYGETFALNLLYRHGILDKNVEDILISEYIKKDKNNPEFHFEFNNYALVDLFNLSKDQKTWQLVYPLKFKNTNVTNWTLLRSNVRFKTNLDLQIAYQEAISKITKFQLSSGLILDDYGVKSFQYHCFSASMLIEIFEITKDQDFLISFKKAVTFIRHFILDNGETLYIGRGQEQSFGLGVLLYILSKYYEVSKDRSVLTDISKIFTFLKSFQRNDGSFPLMFNRIEVEKPFNLDLMNPDYAGWYAYNNYFDYLPFLGFFLHKTYQILNHIDCDLEISAPKKNYSDKDFLIYRNSNYSAVCSCPGGYWTNDLPFPLVQYKSKWQTPMLGGEQFQKSLYEIDSLSMPMTKFGNLSWRKFGNGFFKDNYLIWISLFGIQIRKYVFDEREITVHFKTLAWFPSINLISLKNEIDFNENEYINSEVKICFSKTVTLFKKSFSPIGPIKIFKFPLNSIVKMEFIK